MDICSKQQILAGWKSCKFKRRDTINTIYFHDGCFSHRYEVWKIWLEANLWYPWLLLFHLWHQKPGCVSKWAGNKFNGAFQHKFTIMNPLRNLQFFSSPPKINHLHETFLGATKKYHSWFVVRGSPNPKPDQDDPVRPKGDTRRSKRSSWSYVIRWVGTKRSYSLWFQHVPSTEMVTF